MAVSTRASARLGFLKSLSLIVMTCIATVDTVTYSTPDAFLGQALAAQGATTPMVMIAYGVCGASTAMACVLVLLCQSLTVVGQMSLGAKWGVVVVAQLFSVASSVIVLLWPVTPAVTAARVLHGTAAAGYLIYCLILLVELLPKQRLVTGTAAMTAGFTVGDSVAPVLGAIIFDRAGFRAAYMLPAALGATVLLMALLMYPAWHWAPHSVKQQLIQRYLNRCLGSLPECSLGSSRPSRLADSISALGAFAVPASKQANKPQTQSAAATGNCHQLNDSSSSLPIIQLCRERPVTLQPVAVIQHEEPPIQGLTSNFLTSLNPVTGAGNKQSDLLFFECPCTPDSSNASAVLQVSRLGIASSSGEPSAPCTTGTFRTKFTHAHLFRLCSLGNCSCCSIEPVSPASQNSLRVQSFRSANATNHSVDFTSVVNTLQDPVVFCQCVLLFLEQLVRSSLTVILPATMGTATWLVGVVYIADAAGAVLSPFVVDCFTSKLPRVSTQLMASIASLIMGIACVLSIIFSTSVAVLAALLFLFGASQSAVETLVCLHIAKRSEILGHPTMTQVSMCMYILAQTAAAGIGSLTGGALQQQAWGMQIGISALGAAISSGFGLVVGLKSYLHERRLRAQKPTRPVTEGAPDGLVDAHATPMDDISLITGCSPAECKFCPN